MLGKAFFGRFDGKYLRRNHQIFSRVFREELLEENVS